MHNPGPQRRWACVRAQERFNADFEALRQRKRGCLEQLRAAQRRMAELAAQAAALGGGLGADGELAFAALQDCELPGSVLIVQARRRQDTGRAQLVARRCACLSEPCTSTAAALSAQQEMGR